jgi:hypothetical protein
MKKSHLLTGCAALAAALGVGCSHLDFAAPGDPDRVLVGTVSYSGTIPDNAEVLVRVVDRNPPPANANPLTPPGQMPQFNRPVTATISTEAVVAQQELGVQIIKHPGPSPVPYRIEYRAEDEVLRHGVNIEVRISYDGRVRMFNSNQYSVTLPDVKDPHPVEADPMR